MKTGLKTLCMATILFLPASLAAATYVIEHVSVIDGTGSPAKSDMSVQVINERISAVVPAAVGGSLQGNRIDASGKFLIPGLMDMHVHLQGGSVLNEDGQPEAGINRNEGIHALHSYLYSGVTSIYDSGNHPDFIFTMRAAERSGEIVSPRIFATGAIVTYPGSHGSYFGDSTVSSWPEAIPVLDRHIARKPDILKLTLEERGWGMRPMIPHLPVNLMEKIIEYYNDHGIRTTVHTPSEIRARQAIFAGIDNLSHPVIVGPISEKFAQLMAAKQIPMVTTLTIGENYSRLAEHPEYLDQPLYQTSLSADEIIRLKTETRQQYQDRQWTWWMKLMTPVAQENLKQLHAAGAVLVVGTDQTLGPAVHREMELLAAAGIPPLEIIRMATLHGARFLGRERDMGTVQQGKLADLVLLNADPSIDINNAKAISMVIKNGEIIDLDGLDLAGR